ncbi:MAG: 50S ribosomal protein L15 [Coxiella sp. RIFCSPHIGHO2_12_FULL_42_15]|nr:MAG: 50S ribosomal protein L15 [Coxiella sp. RIFCSPHIGHO2_12_FULL_42_15]
MHLNTIKPAPGAKKGKTRLGRGVGSGLGKTAGRGHKGQHARAGGYHKVGFEGGQMPMQRRLPKFGFNSRQALVSAEVRLCELNEIQSDVVDLQSLLEAGIIGSYTKAVKVFLKGELKKALTVRGIRVSKGAKAAIEKAGGKVEE